MESVRCFNFESKNELHQFIIKHKDFLKSLVDIKESSGISASPFKPNDFYEYFMKNAKGKNRVYLFYEGKEPIGLIYGYKAPFEKNEFTLSFFAVKKEYQGKGIGRRFLRKVYDKLSLKELGFTTFGMVAEKGTRIINQKIASGRKYKLESKGIRDKVIVRPKLRHIIK